MNMGVIAEDDSDVDMVRMVTLSLLRPRVVGFKRFVGNGCGKLRRKCGAWAKILVQQGCQWVVVVHDLDERNETQLRAELANALRPAMASASVVLLPKREIEAWLLYDARAIAAAYRERQQPRLPGNPESLSDPKRHLGDLIWRSYRKNYLHTIHNARIAMHIDMRQLTSCPSFAPHIEFTRTVRREI